MAAITNKEFVGRIAGATRNKYGTAAAAVRQFMDEIVSELARGSRL